MKSINTLKGRLNIATEPIDDIFDYEKAYNKPSINNVFLEGNKTLKELGIQPAGDYILKSEIPEIPEIPDFSGYTSYVDTKVTELEAKIRELESKIGGD